MAKKYLTPDFDVTVYDIKDIITVTVTDEDPDGTSWKDDDGFGSDLD